MKHILTVSIPEHNPDSQHVSRYSDLSRESRKEIKETTLPDLYKSILEYIVDCSDNEYSPDDISDIHLLTYPIIGVPFGSNPAERFKESKIYGYNKTSFTQNLNNTSQLELIKTLYSMRAADLNADKSGLGDEALFYSYVYGVLNAPVGSSVRNEAEAIFKEDQLPLFDEIFLSYMTTIHNNNTEPDGEFDYVLSYVATRWKRDFFTKEVKGYGIGPTEQYLRVYKLLPEEKSMITLLLP